MAHHRQRLRTALAREPDFAGCWRVVKIGCGTSCVQLILVHPDSRVMRWAPTASFGARYRRDSELLLVDPPDSIEEARGGAAGDMDRTRTRRYRFDAVSATLIPLHSDPEAKPLQLFPPAGIRHEAAAALHQRLRRIVEQRDVEALEDRLADDVLVSFGGNGGITEFRSHWDLHEEPGESRLWFVLDRLLRLPPAVHRDPEGSLWLTWPYYFARWPDGFEAHRHVFVADLGVPIQAEARDRAAVLQRASFEGLPLADVEVPRGWTAVATASGGTGYVKNTWQVSAVLGYRLLLEHGSGEWRIYGLVAGD